MIYPLGVVKPGVASPGVESIGVAPQLAVLDDLVVTTLLV